MDLYQWLEATDKRYEVEGIPLGERATKACFEYFLKHGGSMFLPARFRELSGKKSECDLVRVWYQSKYGENALKPAQNGEFLSVFYWNGHFWRINFPIVFGTVRLDPLDIFRYARKYKKRVLFKSRQLRCLY